MASLSVLPVQLVRAYWKQVLGEGEPQGEKRELDIAFAPDPSFQAPIWYDSEVFSGPELRNFPCWLGLPPGEDISSLFDCRPLEEVLWAEDWIIESGILRIGSLPFGYVSSFQKEVENHGFDLGPWTPPEWPVVVVEKEYVCPARKRIILRPGQVYGAPIYIGRIQYGLLNQDQVDAARKQLLSKTAEGFGQSAAPETSPLLKAKFQALMVESGSKLVFKFHTGQDALYVNGNRWMKGRAARIMFTILRDYNENGCRKFEFARFKNDPVVTQNSKRSNFELYLQRLGGKLQTSQLGIQLTILGRGRFELETENGLEIDLVNSM